MTASRTLVCLTALTIPMGTSFADELPATLKAELQRIERQFDTLEQRIGKQDKDRMEQSVRELKQWVDEFTLDAELLDDDPILVSLNKRIASVADLARTAKPAEPAAPKKMEPKKKSATELLAEVEKMTKLPVDLANVSFKKDVAPIIANVCMRCHNSQQKSGEFDSSTYATFIEHITPGDPDGSHIIGLVTGREQPRMPRGGQTAFDKEWLDIWTAWIKQGAKFDGTSKTAAITTYLIDLDTQRRQFLASLSTGDLDKIHRSMADRQIQIVNPKKKVEFRETTNLLVYTTLSAEDTEYVAVLAEAVVEELQTEFGLPKDKPIWRGKLGLNAFADRFDYLAFAKEIDGYAPEAAEFGHARSRPEHQYLALTTTHPGFSLDGIVAHQVAAAFLQQLGQGKLPPWAVHGYARFKAAKLEGKNDSQGFSAELVAAVEAAASGKKAWDLFGENMPWVQLAPMSTSFFHYLSDVDPKRTTQFVKVLAESGNWQSALQQTIGADNDRLTAGWTAWLQKNVRVRR